MERQINNVKTYLLAKGQPFEIISVKTGYCDLVLS
nr:MAG TPA: hypothetical protein [Caudoviricetes sp.]DAH98255.1 MAG TPA: hypothetical protein [Caudoviricetes sp.]